MASMIDCDQVRNVLDVELTTPPLSLASDCSIMMWRWRLAQRFIKVSSMPMDSMTSALRNVLVVTTLDATFCLFALASALPVIR
ncbi:hypothetical protein D3C76_1633380 [compost metagenome]